MVNRENYQLARTYLIYLRTILRAKSVSVERYWFYLRHFLIWLDETPVSEASTHTPPFTDYIETIQATRHLSSQTITKILQISRRFLNWCKERHPSAFKRLTRDWIKSLRTERGADIPKPRQYFTLDEMKKIAALQIPEHDLALQRDRAAACMLFLSGMRIGAFVSVSIALMNVEEMTVRQFPSESVKTKNGKHATTYLLNIPELVGVVRQWDSFVRASLPSSAPWYAHIIGSWGEQRLSFDTPAQSRAGNFNKRLKILLSKANVPVRSAHKFRHGHAVYGLQNAKSLADYKAVSQNLMHENIQITDGIYADLVGNEVKSRVTGLGPSPASSLALLPDVDKLHDPELIHALTVLAERLAR